MADGAPPPVVSVVMSVFNGERYVQGAIESILSQDFSDLELIVMDDASTDHTAEIVSAIRDPRVRYVRNTQNFGLARSLNLGIALAQGRYVARQDADDLSLPGRIRKQVEFLESHPQVGLLGTAFVVIDEKGRPLSVIHPPCLDAVLRKRLRRMNCFMHGSVMMRRSSMEAVGGYRPLPMCQDYDLWLRLAERCEVANLPEPLFQWRLNLAGLSVQKAALQARYAALARQMALERRQGGGDRLEEAAHGNGLEERPETTANPWGFPVNEHAIPYLVLAGSLFNYGAPLQAVRFGLKGLREDPWNRHVWGLLLRRPLHRVTARLTRQGRSL